MGFKENITPLYMNFIKKPICKLSFPFIRQTNMMECGTTCLAMIFKFHGMSNYRNILNSLAEIGTHGTNMYILDQICEKFGYKSDGYKLSIANLNQITLPCIAHYEGNHFVVIYKVEKEYIKIADPAIGKIKITLEEFTKKWNGIVLEVIPTKEILKDKNVIEYIKKQEQERKVTLKNFYLSVFKSLKKNLFQIIIASIILQIIGLSFPFFTQVIIDEVLAHQNSKLLMIILGGMFVILLTQVLLTYARDILLAQFKAKSEFEFFSNFFSHFIRLQQKFFDSMLREELINRFKENLKLRQILSPSIFQRIVEIPLLIGYFLILFLYNTNLALITISFISIYIIVIYLLTPQLIYIANSIFKEDGKVIGLFLDSLLGIHTLKLLSAEYTQSWKWKNTYKNNLNKVLNSEEYFAKINTFLKGLSFIGQISVYWTGGYYTFQGELTIGQYIAFITIFSIILNQINNVTLLWFMFTDLSAIIMSFNDILSHKSEKFSIMEKKTHFNQSNIKLENVFFTYNKQESNYVLKNINIEIKDGEFVGIVGKNGSGKSTFVKLLANLYPEHEGKISVGNIEISNYDLHFYRKNIFLLPQETNLFNDTILQNIKYGMPEASTENVINAAKLADLHDYIKGLYLGYNYKIGDMGGRLSGGQKLKVAFARLFLRDPHIIILDEASSSLDTETEHKIMFNIRNHFKNKTIISIAHRYTTLKNADRIIVFDKGEIIETGTHTELIEQKGNYFNLIKNYINF
jgi:ABC-type bacteriocin/lantibiotic exporter with double-glycine peptidase domain